MKKVLIVSFDFPPQGGTGTIRATKFVKYLPQFGWQPVVLCSDAQWNPDNSLLSDIPPETPVYRVPWPRWLKAFLQPPPNSSTPAKPASAGKTFGTRNLKNWALRWIKPWLIPEINRFWTPAARRKGRDLYREHHYAAILTTVPPNSIHLVGAGLHADTGCPWIADFRDPWTLDNQDIRRNGALNYGLHQRLERQILENCTISTIVTPQQIQRTTEVFGSHLAPKLRLLTNGFDPDDFTAPLPPPDPEFTIAYIGTVLGPIVHNAFPEGLRLATEQDTEFRRLLRLRITGRIDPTYAARFAGMEDRLEYSPFLPHETAIAQMRSAQLLTLIQPDTGVGRMICPNKLYEYMAARRPILALLPPGAASSVLNEGPFGRVVSPTDPQAIAAALLNLFHAIRAGTEPTQMADTIINRFDRREIAHRLASFLDELTPA